MSITNAELAHLIVTSPEFERVFGEKLDLIDERNRTGLGTAQMGRPARWSARQLEGVLVYRRVSGVSTVKMTRQQLLLDREAQMLLGLGSEIPSAPTITRYLTQHFDANERRSLHRELDRQLRRQVIQLPGFDEEARILGMDGSQHATHFTPPIPKTYKLSGKPTGTMLNTKKRPGERGAITAPDAGFVGGNHAKSGRGWQMVGLWSEHGTLLSWDISPLNQSEQTAAKQVLENYEREVLPYRGAKTISVCSADGGFSAPGVREQLQDLRIVPNIHLASHGKKTISKNNATRRNRMWVYFRHPSKPHYRNWGANGHGEVSCKCGTLATEAVNEVGRSGKLKIAVRGSCEKCGSVTITAGRWRKSKNPPKYVLALEDEVAPEVGNSLTFNDPIAREYGRDRFGFGESVHATLARRFGLLKESWMRTQAEVETEFAIVGSAISVLLLERARRQEPSQPEAENAELMEAAA